MNNSILNTVIQEFINNNLENDVVSLLLKNYTFENIELKEIISQIEAKNKCKTKLPTWFNTQNIYYPNKLNIEQTSSENTAEYKQQIVGGNSIIDLTGGLGVDCFYFSKTFDAVTHCEINPELSEIVTHNYKQLDITNIQTIAQDGLEYLKKSNKVYDWIYIDPSRRHEIKGKVFYLKDCLPNVPEQLDALFKQSNNILIKASPMLDISVGISELSYVKEIHIVAVNNEVKELLFVLKKGNLENVSIITVNLKKEKQITERRQSVERFDYEITEETEAIPQYSDTEQYLYEPNAAVLKAGAFKILAERLNIKKLHRHSHLYTSTKLIDFPGRKFKILETFPYNKNLIKKRFKNKKINITTRNFPESVAIIKNKFGIKDGGSNYLFFTTNVLNNKMVILCEKA